MHAGVWSRREAPGPESVGPPVSRRAVHRSRMSSLPVFQHYALPSYALLCVLPFLASAK